MAMMLPSAGAVSFLTHSIFAVRSFSISSPWSRGAVVSGLSLDLYYTQCVHLVKRFRWIRNAELLSPYRSALQSAPQLGWEYTTPV